MSNREYRLLNFKVRAAKENTIEGYAAVFNTMTDLGWFREQIAPGAFKRAIAEKQDVRCLFNHNPDQMLGRTKSGTLTLEEDNTGLKFNCSVPDTTIGKDVYAMIQRGDVDQCSFAFNVKDEEVTYDDEGKATRTVKDVDLFDVSPVTYPAYPTTSVQARSIEETAKHLKRDAEDGDPDECECNCRACYSAECNECDMHMTECGDAENCCAMSAERSAKIAARASKKTKRVDGEDLTAGDFLYVGDPDKTDTWSLPWKFSTEEKTKSHLRNALARFDQTKNIPSDKKAEVHAKLVAKCKEYGIHVSGDESNSAALTVEMAKARTRLAEISLTM